MGKHLLLFATIHYMCIYIYEFPNWTHCEFSTHISHVFSYQQVDLFAYTETNNNYQLLILFYLFLMVDFLQLVLNSGCTCFLVSFFRI